MALRGAEQYDDFDRARYNAAVSELMQETFPDLLDVVAQRHVRE